MKKFISILLISVCLIVATIPSISANEEVDHSLFEITTYTEYYDDGSYTVTTIRQSPVARASVYQTTAEKNVHLYNSSDELQWTYTLIGTFLVTYGESSVCTNSTYSYIIYNDSWSLTAHNNSYYGNIAAGTATFKKKVLFITTNTHDIDAEVGCDIYGNVIS